MDERHLRSLRHALRELRLEHPEMSGEEYAAVLSSINNLTADDVEDIVFPWKCVMGALGYSELASHVMAVEIVIIAPAVMIGFAVEPGFDYWHLEPDEHQAANRAIVAVLRTGGWPLRVNDDGDIAFDRDELEEEIVTQFRIELNTLFPDKPSTQDPLSKWMNPEEE